MQCFGDYKAPVRARKQSVLSLSHGVTAGIARGEWKRPLALRCQTISGAYGHVEEFDTEHRGRGALLLSIIGGSSAAQTTNISKRPERGL